MTTLKLPALIAYGVEIILIMLQHNAAGTVRLVHRLADGCLQADIPIDMQKAFPYGGSLPGYLQQATGAGVDDQQLIGGAEQHEALVHIVHQRVERIPLILNFPNLLLYCLVQVVDPAEKRRQLLIGIHISQGLPMPLESSIQVSGGLKDGGHQAVGQPAGNKHRQHQNGSQYQSQDGQRLRKERTHAAERLTDPQHIPAGEGNGVIIGIHPQRAGMTDGLPLTLLLGQEDFLAAGMVFRRSAWASVSKSTVPSALI